MFSPSARRTAAPGSAAALLGMPVLEASRARFQLGNAARYERETIIAWVFENQRADGSWDGSLLRTSEALLLLGELRSERTAEVNRAIAWLYERQNAEGRFADGCDEAAHRVALCNHFISDFFAPAPRWVILDGLRLDGGYSLGMDCDARVGASSVTCSALLKWGEPEDRLRLHVDGCTRIIESTATGRAPLSTAACCCVLGTLLSASHAPERAGAIHAGLDFLIRSQRADGTWAGADMFLVLETMTQACERGYRTTGLLSALRRSASIIDLMRSSRIPGGAQATTPRQAWVAWKVMIATSNTASS